MTALMGVIKLIKRKTIPPEVLPLLELRLLTPWLVFGTASAADGSSADLLPLFLVRDLLGGFFLFNTSLNLLLNRNTRHSTLCTDNTHNRNFKYLTL